ncbi:MAG: branched-chain amino acid ABC transporter permease [Chloroflexi bacterium]|nr:branched-chain amino acid ABC transporter permease [Chloroflexota bacterium]
MMTTTTVEQPVGFIRRALSNRWIALAFLALYIVIVYAALFGLERASPIFPILSTLAFAPFALTPFVTMALSIDWRFKGLAILLLLFVLMPILGMKDTSFLELAIQICIFAGLALGLNIVVGFAGLLDLGYIAFFAVGAYLWAMFTSPVETYIKVSNALVPASSFYLFMFIGVIIAAIGGILLGLPVLRLRGDYLAIVTLGFGEMIRILAQNSDTVGNPPINFTNGSQGLDGVARPPIPQFLRDLVPTVENALKLDINNAQTVTQQLLFYFIAILVIVIIILVARRLENSPIGRAWTAIREDEVAAIAMGVPLVRMKLLAFAMGASFAGAIGVLYASKQTFVSPESFSLSQSISILAMVIVGGIGSIQGVLLGACVVTLLNLLVLKNLSTQISNWRNIDAIVPHWLIIIVAVIIGLFLLWQAWKLVRSYVNSTRFQTSGIANIIGAVVLAMIAIAAIVFAFTSGEFHIRDWPTQLEPARYERLVFGILLIIMMIFRPAGLLPEGRRRLELQAAKTEQKIEGEV